MSVKRSRIWLCADDYGISPSVNSAIRDLVSRGRINATSVMVVAPSFQPSEANSLAALNAGTRRASVGLHVTLTSPFRPITAGFEPADSGTFLPLVATLKQACLHRFQRRQLTAEITAQIEAFIAAFGRPPDFMDGHQHVQLFPQVSEAMLDVAQARAPHAWVRQCGRILPLYKRLSDRKGLLLDLLSLKFRARATALGVRTNSAFAGTYDFSAQADFAKLFPSFLDGLPDNSVVMCHPGFVDGELKRLDPLTTLREREFAYFADERFPGVLDEHGVALA
jgi:chitin disaccharide deacetylase